MNYLEMYPLIVPMDSGEGLYVEVPPEVTFVNGVDFSDCAPIVGWDERTIATYPFGTFPEVDFPAAFIPMFSPRLRACIELHAPGTMQFLPIRLQHPDGTGEIDDYTVGQALICVDCLDKERTTVAKGRWVRQPGGAYPIRGEVCLLRSAIGDAKLFRIDGFTVKLVVREDLRDAILASGGIACEFKALNVSG